MAVRTALFVVALAASAPGQKLPLEQIKLPPGFSIELFALVPNAREMALGKNTLRGESAWARPADLLELPDGSLLVSDDTAGAIYRIRFSK